MRTVYGRDLDLNLLRVFAVVADAGSVTEAASRLYLTQPAVSAALRRLTDSVGGKLLTRQGRSLVLTHRGRQLQHALHTHLQALLQAALEPSQFAPQTSERRLRLGFSDAAEMWLLPALLRHLAVQAPGMQVIATPVQFRTVSTALAQGLDMAITVADELPPNILRRTLHQGAFVCLFDPRHVKHRRLSEKDYFAHQHVVVSYNGDLRGIVEDAGHKPRTIRCSVSSFANLGAVIDGSRLIATLPRIIAEQLVAQRKHLRIADVPLPLPSSPLELLWPESLDDDPACRFVRQQLTTLATQATKP